MEICKNCMIRNEKSGRCSIYNFFRNKADEACKFYYERTADLKQESVKQDNALTNRLRNCTQPRYLGYANAKLIESLLPTYVGHSHYVNSRNTVSYFSVAHILLDPKVGTFTQDTILRWFRREHNLSLEVFASAAGYGWQLDKACADCTGGTFIAGSNNTERWDEFEDAVEAGINYVLNELISEKV